VRWIIDGMNLIGSRPDGWWRDRAAARRRLVEELSRFTALGGDRVEVVFDGAARADEVDRGVELGVAVSFAPGGPNAADRVIAEMARNAADPGGTTVVTSDGPLASSVRATGVDVVGVAAFRRLLDGP
jgi:predicted RNA-binding protein with PIN domain